MILHIFFLFIYLLSFNFEVSLLISVVFVLIVSVAHAQSTQRRGTDKHILIDKINLLISLLLGVPINYLVNKPPLSEFINLQARGEMTCMLCFSVYMHLNVTRMSLSTHVCGESLSAWELLFFCKNFKSIF